MWKFIILPLFGFLIAACDNSNVQNQVASNVESQYYMAKRNGAGAIDVCVQASLVSAVYLQLNDEENYGKWKKIEKTDCLAAGINM